MCCILLSVALEFYMRTDNPVKFIWFDTRKEIIFNHYNGRLITGGHTRYFDNPQFGGEFSL